MISGSAVEGEMRAAVPARRWWRISGGMVGLTLWLMVGPGPGPNAAGYEGTDPAVDADTTRVDLLYATNRRLADDGRGEMSYTGERGQTRFGRAEVEFVAIPGMRHIAPKVGFYVPRETNSLRLMAQLDEAAFWEQVERAATATRSGSVVVFVHGYNYGFERTSRMAAEIQRMLRGDATVLMFSWPSNGSPTDYIPDQADVEWSVPFLGHVIGRLADRLGPDRVSILAHSLGSRGTVFALERLMAGSRSLPVLDQLVFVAPDFDAQAFVDRLPGFAAVANAITVYASSNDRALQASHALHQAPRLGEAAQDLTVAAGIETIDVSGLGRYRFLGHQYFYFHPRISADIADLLRTGRRAASRPGLRAEARDDVVFWRMTDQSTTPAGGAPVTPGFGVDGQR